MEELNPEAIYPTGFEEAITGIVSKDGTDVFVVSTRKCLDILMKRDDMTWEDAADYFEYNIHGSYMGKHNPVYQHDAL